MDWLPSIIITIIIIAILSLSFPLSRKLRIPFRLRHGAVAIGGGLVFSFFFIIMIHMQLFTGRTTMLDFNRVGEIYIEIFLFTIFLVYQYIIFLSILGVSKRKVKRRVIRRQKEEK